MRKIHAFITLLCLLTLSGCGKPKTEVRFSPPQQKDKGCTATIIKEIEGAKKSIRVQAYILNYGKIIQALSKARERGVNVELILDAKNYNGLRGFTIRLDNNHNIAHNKIIIIDDKTVITGSFNFTYSAETVNAENIVIIRDRKIVRKYVENWKTHAEHSRLLE